VIFDNKPIKLPSQHIIIKLQKITIQFKVH